MSVSRNFMNLQYFAATSHELFKLNKNYKDNMPLLFLQWW